MRIVVVTSFFGMAIASVVGYDYPSASADLPSNSEYPNVGSLELNTFAPTSGVDSYGLGVYAFDLGLNKEFYHYSAPEEELPHVDGSHPAITRVKKNLRVIFIKAPENNLAAKAALQLAQQTTSDQTAIYVLSKQPDVSELANEIQDLKRAVRHKPEVRFVKYKTAEDAVNLQLGIQQQYESLRGTSRSINGGAAPVLDLSLSSPQIGEAVNVAAEQNFEESLSTSPAEGGREYIPPTTL